MRLTIEELKDLVETTLIDFNVVHKFATGQIYTKLSDSKCFVLAWISDEGEPIYFDIMILINLQNNIKEFFNYVRLQLRKVGVEC